MGLDVYLYHYEGMPEFKDLATARASFDKVSKEAEEASEACWPKDKSYETLTDKEKDAFSAKGKKASKKVIKGTPWEKSMDEYGSINFTPEKCIEINSTKYPEHMFKIGYFRSSYNDGGINHVLENNGIPTLYDMFVDNQKDYIVKPNWQESLSIVKQAIADFKPIAAEGLGVMFVDSLEPITSDKEALTIYRAERDKIKNRGDGGPFSGSGYSNAKGAFYINGKAVQARGFISGKNCIGRPGTYVIYDVDSEEGLSWYIKALEVVQETIEWVLAQPDPQNYYFHWSG